MATEVHPVRTMSAEHLRALAHPLRLQLLQVAVEVAKAASTAFRDPYGPELDE
jgi:hypothetical protein